MRRVVLAVSMACAVLAFSVARPSARTYENARAVGKRCSTCHDSKKPDLTNLNGAGRYYLTHRSLDGYKPEPNPPRTAGPGKAADPGQAVYAQACSPCHGTRGEGTTIAGTLVGPRKYAKTEAETVAVIRTGIKGTVMAPFAGALSDGQIRAVARYVSELRARAK